MSIENILTLADQAKEELEKLDTLLQEMWKYCVEVSGKEPLPPVE